MKREAAQNSVRDWDEGSRRSWERRKRPRRCRRFPTEHRIELQSNFYVPIPETQDAGLTTRNCLSSRNSIRERGVLQPVLVRRVPDNADAYEIIAGERRWRAAQRAGQHDVPIVILELSDREALEAAIVENIQRIDLNALEEAAGFAQLGTEYGYSHADIARIVGKSRSHVANTLRLINLPDHARQLLADGHISAGHARALLPLGDPDKIADLVVNKRLSVRDVERLAEAKEVDKQRVRRRGRVESTAAADPDAGALKQKLELELGTTVSIRHNGKSGELRIAFRDFDQLEALCQRLV